MLDILKRIAGRVNLDKVKASKCGHCTHLKGPITAMGHTTTLTIPRNSAGTSDWCLECCAKMTVPCAKCGGHIMIGDPAWPIPFEQFSRLFGPPVDGSAQILWFDQLHYVLCSRAEGQKPCGHYDLPMIGGRWVPGQDGRGTIQKLVTEEYLQRI